MALLLTGCGSHTATHPSLSYRPGVVSHGTTPDTDATGTGAGSSPATPSTTGNDGNSAEAHLQAAASLVPQITDSENRLVIRCMQAQGFKVQDPSLLQPAPIDLDLPTAADYSRITLSPSLADARRYGYSKPTASATPPPGGYQKKPGADDPFYQQPQSYQSRYQNAVGTLQEIALADGTSATVPQGGCRLSIDRQIFGDVDTYYGAVSKVFAVYDVPAQQMLKNTHLESATAAWSSCMHAAGYSYSSPTQLPSDRDTDVRAQPGDIAGKKREIAIASADATCADKTNIRAITKTAWSSALAAYLQANQTAYGADEQLFNAAQAKATKLLNK